MQLQALYALEEDCWGGGDVAGLTEIRQNCCKSVEHAKNYILTYPKLETDNLW